MSEAKESEEKELLAIKRLLISEKITKEIEELRKNQDSIKLYIGGAIYNLILPILESIDSGNIKTMPEDERITQLKKLAEVANLVTGKNLNFGVQVNQNFISEEEAQKFFGSLHISSKPPDEDSGRAAGDPQTPVEA